MNRRRHHFHLSDLLNLKHMKERKWTFQEAYDYCENNHHSTEFMLVFMQDACKATDDEVLKWLTTEGGFKLDEQ